MKILKNKNILFSVDNIFGYKESVEKELKEIFNVVEYIERDIPDKNERTLFFKVLREFSKKNKTLEKYYKRYVKKYFKLLLNNYRKIEFDYFFVIAGREFSKEFIQELKKRNPKIKCILFLWDKFEYTTLRNSADEFDYIFSFDPEDCKKYGFIFRPSFFISDCEKNKIEYNKRKFDIYYLGSLRDKIRYKIIYNIYIYIYKLGLNYFLKLFINKKNKKYLPKSYEKDLIILEKISYKKNIEILKNSKVVLDINFSEQLGLTLRSIEAIGSETKIITTNKSIINYDFYNKENIIYIENVGDISLIPKEFFTKKYKKLSENIKEKYKAKGFIEDIFKTINLYEKEKC